MITVKECIIELDRQLSNYKAAAEIEAGILADVKIERDRLRENLEKYGNHLNNAKHPMCDIYRCYDCGCSCGFDEALAQPEQQQEATP